MQGGAKLAADMDLVAKAMLTQQELESALDIKRTLLAFIRKQGWPEDIMPMRTEIQAGKYRLNNKEPLEKAFDSLAKKLKSAVQHVNGSSELSGYVPWQLLALHLRMQPSPSKGGGPARQVIPYGVDAPIAAQAAAQAALAPWEPPGVRVHASHAQQRQMRLDILKVMQEEGSYSFPTMEFMRAKHGLLEKDLNVLGRDLIEATARLAGAPGTNETKRIQNSIRDAVSTF